MQNLQEGIYTKIELEKSLFNYTYELKKILM